MGKRNIYTEDSGDRLRLVSGVISGCGTNLVGGTVSDWDDRKLIVIDDPPLRPNHGIVRVPVHPRGFLESVLIVQLAGSATDFSVVLLDRMQEGNYPPNWIWTSSTVVAVAGEEGKEKPYPYGDPEYGDSYTEYTAGTYKMIHAYGIMAPYENRSTYKHDMSEIYLMVFPNAGTNNEYSVKIATIALA